MYVLSCTNKNSTLKYSLLLYKFIKKKVSVEVSLVFWVVNVVASSQARCASFGCCICLIAVLFSIFTLSVAVVVVFIVPALSFAVLDLAVAFAVALFQPRSYCQYS